MVSDFGWRSSCEPKTGFMESWGTLTYPPPRNMAFLNQGLDEVQAALEAENRQLKRTLADKEDRQWWNTLRGHPWVGPVNSYLHIGLYIYGSTINGLVTWVALLTVVVIPCKFTAHLCTKDWWIHRFRFVGPCFHHRQAREGRPSSKKEKQLWIGPALIGGNF